MLSCKKREFVLRSSICAAAASVMLGWQWPTVAKDSKEACFLTNRHYSHTPVPGLFWSKEKKSYCLHVFVLRCYCAYVSPASTAVQMEELQLSTEKSLVNTQKIVV